jgi:hypothetical protein
MGQQQLLLILLGIVVVGIALAVGLAMFMDNSASVNREAVTHDLINLAASARVFYRRPATMGGGDGTFTTGGPSGTGLTDIRQLTTKPVNANGRYVLGAVATSEITITGIGRELADPASPDTVMVVMKITPEGATVVAMK